MILAKLQTGIEVSEKRFMNSVMGTLNSERGSGESRKAFGGSLTGIYENLAANPAKEIRITYRCAVIRSETRYIIFFL